MRFTKIPDKTFQELQLNAGVLLSDFDPATGTLTSSAIMGATSGGVNFTATPTYTDYGEDIDNCPANMKELKRLSSIEAKMSGTFVSISADLSKTLATADTDSKDATHIVPRNDLADADFADVWWVGDFSDKNGEKNGGFIAIHLFNSLSTGGFQIQSSDDAKGQFAFEFTGHYTLDDQDKVPYELYIKAGSDEATQSADVKSSKAVSA